MSPGDSELILRQLESAAYTSVVHARLKLAVSKVSFVNGADEWGSEL